MGCSNINTTNILDYLEKNNSILNLKDVDDFEGLDLIKEDIKDKKIIFTGGFEGLKKDDLLNMKLIKYLQKNIGLNYYLIEMGYSDTYFINEYLETGDENILQKAFSNMEHNIICNDDEYNFFKNLYKFNKTLNQKDRIKIIGIGVENSIVGVYEYINRIIKDDSLVTNEIKELLKCIEELNSYLKFDESQIKDKNYEIELFKNLHFNLNILTNRIDERKDYYINLFQNDFFGLEIVLKNLKVYSLGQFTSEDEYLQIKENQLYENFIVQDEKLYNPLYFGQLSMYHINKIPIRSYDNFESIASKINNSAKYKGKVMSILYKYSNIYNFQYGNSLSRELFNTYLDSLDDCIIFNLGNTDSPLNKVPASLFIENEIYDSNKPIGDYIDCMVILKGVSESQKIYLDK